MQGTASPPATPGAKVPWRQVYSFAALCAALDADELDREQPTPEVAAWIGALFPSLTDDGIGRLWSASRLDAAALGQLEAGDCHRWPLADMDPPHRLTRAFDVFENELADAIRFELRRVSS